MDTNHKASVLLYSLDMARMLTRSGIETPARWRPDDGQSAEGAMETLITHVNHTLFPISEYWFFIEDGDFVEARHYLYGIPVHVIGFENWNTSWAEFEPNDIMRLVVLLEYATEQVELISGEGTGGVVAEFIEMWEMDAIAPLNRLAAWLKNKLADELWQELGPEAPWPPAATVDEADGYRVSYQEMFAEGLYHWMGLVNMFEYVGHSTGWVFLDMDAETAAQMHGHYRWDRETVDYLTRDWRGADTHSDCMFAFQEWCSKDESNLRRARDVIRYGCRELVASDPELRRWVDGVFAEAGDRYSDPGEEE